MPGPTGARRTSLAVVELERRDTPAGFLDTFDTPGASIGAGWAERSADPADVLRVVAGVGVDASSGVVSDGTSRSAGLAWRTTPEPADAAVGFRVKLTSLVPTLLFARGSNLDTAAPSYVAVSISRGAAVEVWDVQAGQGSVRASVASSGAAYFSGGWAKVTLTPTGSRVAVRVQREDTGRFLTPQGTWQAAATDAILTTTQVTGGGNVGFGRAARFAGPVAVDDFQIIDTTPPPLPGVSENFDTAAPGARPAGWSGWSSDGASGFIASAARALSPANGYASAGGSASAARGWSDAALPADVDASAAVYLDGILPAQVFVRGANLEGTAPTYYGVAVTRGLEARLVKVVNGVETTLGTVKSAGWFTNQWLRVRLTAEGDRLRVTLFRADARQWLTSAGTWSDSPDFALERRDGAITAAGKTGVARPARYSGTVAFDDFEARPAAAAAAGPAVTVTGVSFPNGSVAGDITFTAAATGAPTRIEFVLNGQVRAASATTPAEWTFDTTTVLNGAYTLTVRAFDAAGNVGTAEYPFRVSNPDNDPVPKPTIPRHYDHIRIAQLAYSGNPMGAFEQDLLRTSVDVVIPNARFMPTIDGVSPATPQLLYSNVSNLYQGLLADWLAYADRTGAAREQAFYHVTRATPFVGSSPSSQPVTWFWSAYQSAGGTQPVTNVTSAARGGTNANLNFGAAGSWTAIGSLEKFREMNVTLAVLPQGAWAGVWEYVAATDPAGNPAVWQPLATLQDGTARLTRSGGVVFDPPADWKTSTIGGGARQFYVRFRVTDGDAAQAARLRTVFGRDYVRAAGGQAGVIPAFDYAADADRDGYLNDAEYAARAAGKDARFVYESRLFYPYYGQMRYVTNPGGSAVRKWAAEFHVNLLAANPLADGVFMDNATGNLPFAGTPVLEPTATFAADSGALIAAVNRAIAPRWVMANTAGGRTTADPIAAGSAAVIEEFLIRPLTHSWAEVGDTAALVARRLGADGGPYVVIDSRSDAGGPRDPRTQLATLAYYYLLADPDRSMLMFYGGENPSSTWADHWSPAAAVNVGRPTGEYRTLASGTDPFSPVLTYRVFARDYSNGLVLYKPLSYAQGIGEGTIADQTATTHQLGGNFRRVNADGTLGTVVSSVTLRNGEGAVFVRA